MNEIKFINIIILIMIFMQASCKKEDPCIVPPENTKKISETEKIFVPYNGNEELVFLEPNQDTLIILKGIGKKEYFEEENTLFEDCRGNYFYETFEYKYKGVKDPAYLLTVKMKKYLTDDLKLSIEFLNRTFNFTAFEYKFYAQHYDSLNVNGKVYYDIYKTKDTYDSSYVYFSPKNGIIRFEFSHGEIGTIPR